MDDAKQISSAVKSEKADFIDGGHDNDFECTGDEVLVESSPPPSPEMAAQLAAPAQGAGAGSGSPNPVRELIVIPELPNVHIQHTIQQVEVNGDSSGHSSPTTEAQHTYIAVAMQGAWKHQEDRIKIELPTDQESEGGNGVNYVQYVEPQEIYTQGHQTQMETLRTYPLYGVGTSSEGNDTTWSNSGEYTAYGVVVTGSVGDEAPASPAAPPSAAAAPPQRMPPATVQWLLEHYETAEGVSLPRSSLYAHYLRHCTAHRLEPVNAASFGKLIRSVFVGLRTRRLGTRGNSKYHYYGIRAKTTGDISPRHDSDNDKSESVEPESRERDTEVASTSNAACMAASIAHRSYLGAVEVPPPPSPPPPAPRRAPAALAALQRHHADNGVQFLEACAALDIAAVERSRRAFWRRAPRELPRRELRRLAADKQVAAWLLRADLHLYQKAVELLLPDVLSPIPPQLTQAIRNFAKSVESALAAGAVGSPSPARRAQAASAAALCAALRRYTSLNHLAQAARAVLANTQQIHQMLADLNRVDFRVVREQAAWACSCVDPNTAHKLEADFKATLGRGATLEQWAEWLEGCVDKALVNTKPADYTSKARRLLLDWSFYSSLVIRELTLRSAASFGSFHLIRLLYDEYVSYLVERRVAEQLRVPPIGVMQRATEMEDDTPEDPAEADDINDDQDWEWADDDDDDDDDDEVESKKECR